MSPLAIVLITLAAVAHVTVVVGALTRAFVLQSPSRASRRFQALAAGLGVSCREGETALSFDSHGLQLSVSWRKPHKQPPLLAVETSQPPVLSDLAGAMSHRAGETAPLAERHAILFRRETLVDRMGKALGINREVQTGDSVFDDTVYIESTAPEASVERVLRAPEARQGILELFELGWTRVRLYDGETLVSAQRANPGADRFDATLMRQTAPALSRVAGRIPTAEGAPVHGRTSTPAMLAILAPAVGMAGWIGFLYSRNQWPLLSNEPYWVGVASGAAMWLLAQVAVGLLVRGKADSFRVFLLHFFASLPACLGAGLFAVLALNGGADDSGPSSHLVPVRRMWVATDKRSPKHYIEVGAWTTGPDVELQVDSALYGRLHEGSSVVVVIRRGRLGWAWLEGVRANTESR